MPGYMMAKREVPLDDSWDVIVVGGGPAGCAAATASAREGARTLLVEAEGALGGMGTLGLVPWFCGYTDGEKNIARGLAEHVRHGLGDNMPHLGEQMEQNPLTTPAIDPESLKRIYDDMVTDAGAEVLFHTQFCSVEKIQDDEVDVLLIANKAGLRAYRSRIYVDCTGDGDLAAWAGAEIEKGDEDGGLQPGTACFIIGNIDEEALAEGPGIHFFDPNSPIHEALKSDAYPDIVDLHTCNIKIGPGTYGFNTGHVYDVDNTDPESISAALIHGRKMTAQYRDAFAAGHPAFRDSFLAATGARLGVRETRRVIGDYYLTLDDYLARASFPDEICRNAYNIDVHGSRKRAQEMAEQDISETKAAIEREIRNYGPGESFGVPYRCLTPKGLRNVLVAGRCISSDRQINGSVRIMACCLTTGEAAGAAAAMASAGDRNVHSVDAQALRQTLKANGAYLPDVNEGR